MKLGNVNKKIRRANTAANQFISTHVSPKCALEDNTYGHYYKYENGFKTNLNLLPYYFKIYA
jgi:hypothetical protein